MAEPTNAEVMVLVLERVGACVAGVERVERELGRLAGRVGAVVEDQTTANVRMDRLETEQAGPIAEAMRSHHDIEMGLRQEVIETRRELKEHLERQDRAAEAAAKKAKDETDAREAAKKKEADDRAAAAAEERRQESLAAKRVDKDRDFWLKAIAIVVPVFVTLITVAGAAFVAWENQKMRDDMAMQYRELRRAPLPAPYELGAPSAPAAPRP